MSFEIYCCFFSCPTSWHDDEVVTAATTTIAVPVPARFSVALISPSVGTFWMRFSFPLFVMYVSCCDDSNTVLCYFLRYCACLDASLTRSASHIAADMTDVLIASSPGVEPQHASSFAIDTTARSQNAECMCTLTPLRIRIFMCLSLFSNIHQQVLCIQSYKAWRA